MKVAVGLVMGKSSISEFSFAVNPSCIPKFGEYVMAENRDGEGVIGIVREISNFNRMIIDEGFSFEYLVKNIDFSRKLLEKNDVVVASATVIGVIRGGEVYPNRVPIKPNSEVRLADDELLSTLFRCKSGVEIGQMIARPDISVSLDIKQLVLRHFAILSVTGGGKSNTVAVLVNDVVRKLNGTVVLIDPHGEYVSYTFEDGSENGKNVVPAGIRPERLEPWEFASLVGIDREKAAVQRMHMERIFTTVKKEGKSGKEFMERVLDIAEEWINLASAKGEAEYYDFGGVKRAVMLDRQDLNALARIKEYVASFMRRYEDLLSQNDMLASIKSGYLNVVNLSGFDEGQMRVVVAYLLRNLLLGRINFVRGKQGWARICPAVRKPLLVVFEEGHIFAPKGAGNDVVTWMGRIAREGRKFGIGLGIVSQRPKRLNDDVLSQCNTKIILRITEPNDQRYVQHASEHISEDLLSDIASLGVGEAVIVGPAVKLPVAVKIRKFAGNYGGRDIDVIGEWLSEEEEQKRQITLEDLAV
ncbi:ATP-binding protein [Archaeoglobus neptunius]|uniref:ATP-binding protein n=1 Tax=Archaeoglobus neptunius TaxID=2798580 RepID=UPI0019256923|nr:ATP-binding protein [Archaeoglobus neptunius]